jgi:protein-S-isoprenylcysteine O-methyltransferase Ste14
MLLRHLLSILLLPFIVVVVVPWRILRPAGVPPARVMHSPGGGLRAALGALLFIAGFALFAWCVRLFARVGRGTLSPWDPTRAMVAVGPYRHVRNPMITGVAMMLLGEAVLWDSSGLAGWALCFLVINHLYFVFSEEPGLERRFGQAYLAYKVHVPRWIPRLWPWSGA